MKLAIFCPGLHNVFNFLQRFHFDIIMQYSTMGLMIIIIIIIIESFSEQTVLISALKKTAD